MTNTIWTYWHQGFADAPYIVRQCIDRLQQVHPEATIHLLDKEAVYDFADTVPVREAVWEQMILPHRSDLLRTQLLLKYGGVWLDPTIYCVCSLEDWLPACMDKGLFLFHRPGRDRIIANWFIAAEPGNYLLQQLYDSLIHYWNEYDFRNLGNRDYPLARRAQRLINGRSLWLSQLWLMPWFTRLLRIYPYMIYHFMFYYLIRKNVRCRQIYDLMPKLSADGPHRLQREGLLQPLTNHAKTMIDNKTQPLFKLKWKLKMDTVPVDSNLDYLLQQL